MTANLILITGWWDGGAEIKAPLMAVTAAVAMMIGSSPGSQIVNLFVRALAGVSGMSAAWYWLDSAAKAKTDDILTDPFFVASVAISAVVTIVGLVGFRRSFRSQIGWCDHIDEDSDEHDKANHA